MEVVAPHITVAVRVSLAVVSSTASTIAGCCTACVVWGLAACVGAWPLLAWLSWFCTSSAFLLPQPPQPAEFKDKQTNQQ